MAERVIDFYPNPWDFGNEGKQLTSSDSRNKLEYSNFYEIGMGAPLTGECWWIDESGYKHFIGSSCSGPPVWDSAGTRVAIPIWVRKFFKGTVQQIMVLNIETRVLIRFKKTFDVLDLRTFDQNEICGYNSPIYKPKPFCINLNKEKIEEERIL